MQDGDTREHGVPPLGPARIGMLREALRRAVSDMRRAPGFGILFSGACVVIGLVFAWVTWKTGHSYWLVFAVVGFPLVGPFAAVGLYEVSHRLDQGQPLTLGAILGVVAHQRRRQLPSICAVIVIFFLFWFFLAHMIFALFLGLSTMTNVSSSFEIYRTLDGLRMLGVGSLVGGVFALVLYMITVLALPLLLDREVDFVTAMITSFQYVQGNFGVMILWAAVIAGLTFVAMLPAFLGLFIVLPLLGHASWHLYRLIRDEGQTAGSAE